MNKDTNEIYTKINEIDSNFYYTSICMETPYGLMPYPKPNHPNYKEYIDWLNLPYWAKINNPPIFFSR